MAYKINKMIKADIEEQKYLVIAGFGHLKHFCGVPERVLEKNPQLKDDTILIVAHEAEREDTLDLGQPELKLLSGIRQTFGATDGSIPVVADYLYLYEEEYEEEEEDGEAVKNETAQAYNKVGETAHLKGNMKKAQAVMNYLGYTEEEFKIAGEDACNYQGVGNPHLHAKIQPGEKVLDLGSGLGVDSFIAAHYTGPKGKVVGLDISAKEVTHA